MLEKCKKMVREFFKGWDFYTVLFLISLVMMLGFIGGITVSIDIKEKPNNVTNINSGQSLTPNNYINGESDGLNVSFISVNNYSSKSNEKTLNHFLLLTSKENESIRGIRAIDDKGRDCKILKNTTKGEYIKFPIIVSSDTPLMKLKCNNDKVNDVTLFTEKGNIKFKF